MLEIKSATWSNFLSYGDYETTLDFTNLDQALIVGEVVGESSEYNDNGTTQKKRSNGAGKSVIPTVIQWTLFGKTMHSPNPGDKIRNWFTEADTVCKIEFKNGDSITRVRRKEGDTELMYTKDGEEHSLVSNTLATSKIQQSKLNKDFNLDWDIFCGSVFFNQYGKPWMEMADQHRKKAIERILHVDKFAYYAAAAKGKVDSVDRSISVKRSRIENARAELARIDHNIVTAQAASDQFGANQKNRQLKLLEAAVNEKNSRDSIQLPDVAQLEAKWAIVKTIEGRVSQLRTQAHQLTTRISDKSGSVNSLRRNVDLWKSKAGTICNSCLQPVAADHASAKIEPLQADITNIESEIAALKQEKATIESNIATTESVLNAKKPEMTVAAANERHTAWKRHDEAIKRNTESARAISQESNPHIEIIQRSEERKVELAAEIVDLEKDIEQLNFLSNHYSYINKAYTDRTKIKSYVFQDHIPVINKRLKHYLEIFDLDIRIELTPSLGISSNMWGYEFESGGERKRTDVAFMLAMFDFHQMMYDRQCNVLVLDEVDGRMDDDGIDALISIIKNDLASKAESILIISHRDLMFDTFPHEIRVVRKDRLSRLTVT